MDGASPADAALCNAVRPQLDTAWQIGHLSLSLAHRAEPKEHAQHRHLSGDRRVGICALSEYKRV